MSTWKPSTTPPWEREPRRVGDSLNRVTDAIGAPAPETLSIVFSRWEQLVGADIAAHAEPRSLRDGVLLVDVDQPAWAAQLGYLSSQLLSRLEAEAGSGAVSEIRFRVVGAGGRDRPRKRP